MKALLYTAPETLNYQDVETPSCQKAHDVLVKIEAVGICGSDMHAYLGHDERRPAPLILGHEAAGIAQNGRYKGKNVAINPLVSCQKCELCLQGRVNICQNREIISMPPRQGAFAEYITIPERNLVLMPDGLSYEAGSLAEPVATGLHAVYLASKASQRPLAEVTALVVGAGAVGLSAALTLAAHGCKSLYVAEAHAGRRDAANQKGVLQAFDPLANPSFVAEGSVDVIIDAVGIKATRVQAMQWIKAGGVIVHVGLGQGMDGFDARKLTLQEVQFLGSYTYSMSDYKAALTMLANGQMGALDWHEVRDLSQGAKAFKDLQQGKVDKAKIILKP